MAELRHSLRKGNPALGSWCCLAAPLPPCGLHCVAVGGPSGLWPEELCEGALDCALVLVKPQVLLEELRHVCCQLVRRLVSVVRRVVAEPADCDQQLAVRGRLVRYEALDDVVGVVRERFALDAGPVCRYPKVRWRSGGCALCAQ